MISFTIKEPVEEIPIDYNDGAAGLWASQAYPCFNNNVSTFVKAEPGGDHLYQQAQAPPNLITNNEEFVCSLCEEFVIEEQGVTLKECYHNFCRPCLIGIIERSQTMQVSCPMIIEPCDKKLTFNEIESLLSLQEFNNFLQKPDEVKKKVTTSTRLLDLEENHDFVENRFKFECSICTLTVNVGDGIILKNCLHEYCKNCLSRHIEAAEELEIPCPFVAGDNSRCEGFLQDRELRYLMTEQVHLAHLARSINQAEAVIKNSFHCKFPNCTGWAEIDDQVLKFQCPVCNNVNCIKCKAVHEPKTCEEYYYEINADARKVRDDHLTAAQLKAMQNQRLAMPCPRCGIIIEKNLGCNHMTCRSCKHEFQWFGLT